MSLLLRNFVVGSGIDYSVSRLFITSPEPRTEVGESAGINISCEAEDATSVAFQYQNESGSWVSIGSGTNSSGDTWTYSSWSPPVSALAVKAIATYPDGSTQECVNNLYSYSINDTFTDTNGTAIASHTPDDNLGAAGWVASGGDWEIQSNALEINTADTNTYELTHDAGNKNAIFRFNLAAFTSTATMQFIFRWDSIDRFLMLLVFTSGAYRILDKYETGTPSATLYDSISSEISAGDDIEIWAIDDTVQIIINGVVNASVALDDNISHTDTKFGFRRAGANDTPRIDNAQIIPIHSPVVDTSQTYNITKHGSIVVADGEIGTIDTDILAPDFKTIGSTHHMVHATKNGSGDFAGLLYRTSPTNDPHNWTVQNSGNYILPAGAESMADCTIEFDGTEWHIVYSDRFTGKLHWAKGTDLNAPTKQGVIKDLTGSNLWLRQSSMFLEDGIWYVYTDVRTDQLTGEFGYIGLMTGSSLDSLSDPIEVFSTPGYENDMLNITIPSVKKHGTIYELWYSGYIGRDVIPGTGFTHVSSVAISGSKDGKFKRVQNTPVIPFGGSGEIDELGNSSPKRLPGTNIVYYVAQGGFTYLTLS